ncbi:sensor histidine kinase [Spiractinospora alimapuensis]|uniref:sensor histidine kinase n=1 Tax=Spiractinospora alimapuensis TaxID=2820884 RepID=UPI001F1CF066|nr:histidine kinase [Spiractinospora alimapuensis]QVQ54499.1 sensor histidine kinase [Spiractinospora alimapuensis]
MPTYTARLAITRAPHRFLLSWWPWRALLYLVLGALPAVVLLGAVNMIQLATEADPVWITVALLGFLVVVLGGAPLAARWARVSAGLVGEPLERPVARSTSVGLRDRLAAPYLWREVAYSVLSVSVLFVLDVAVLVIAVGAPVPAIVAYANSDVLTLVERAITVVAWASLWLVGAYLLTAWASARAEIVRAVLAPRDERLARELREMTRSRAALAEAFDQERQRIERDLHDGAQQRLVAVKASLGLARLDLPPDAPAADAVREAREQVTAALDELRDLVRGIYPLVLTERGLPAAVWDVAARAAVPVEVEFHLPDRLPGPVESTAYFVVCEAIANAAKHAPRSTVRVEGSVRGARLRVDIVDDGPGGASPSGGGLSGLRNRLAILGGTLVVDSPDGGPTRVRLEIPL